MERLHGSTYTKLTKTSEELILLEKRILIENSTISVRKMTLWMMLIFLFIYFFSSCYASSMCWNGGKDPSEGEFCECPFWFRNNDQPPGKCSKKSCGYVSELTSSNDCDCGEDWSGHNCEICNTVNACRNYFRDTGAELENDIQVTCRSDSIYSHQRMNILCETDDEYLIDIVGEYATFQCDGVGYADSFPEHMEKACYLQTWGRFSYNGTDGYMGQTMWCELYQCTAELTTSKAIIYHCEDTRCYSTLDYADDLSEWGSDYKRVGIADQLTGTSEMVCQSDGICKLSQEGIEAAIFELKCRGSECLEYDFPIYFPERASIDYVLYISLPSTLLVCIYYCLCVICIDCCWFAKTEHEKHSLKDYKEFAGCDLEFTNIRYHIKPSLKNRLCMKGRVKILRGISFHIEPGTLCSIMGAKGSGKTTFMDILAQRNKSGKIGGNIYFNSQKINCLIISTFLRLTGYAVQDDFLMKTMTVRESIMFSADLRLPVTFCACEKKKRCDEVMKMLGIYDIKGRKIGDRKNGEGNGLSGGERKLVSIAVELVVDPHLLFIDEPTSGLDSSTAHELVSVLKRLSVNHGRTIVLSIHQPQAKIFRLFDTLILLSKGRMVYGGRASRVVPEFERVYDKEFPGGTENPADWVLKILCDNEETKSVKIIDPSSPRINFEVVNCQTEVTREHQEKKEEEEMKLSGESLSDNSSNQECEDYINSDADRDKIVVEEEESSEHEEDVGGERNGCFSDSGDEEQVQEENDNGVEQQEEEEEGEEDDEDDEDEDDEDEDNYGDDARNDYKDESSDDEEEEQMLFENCSIYFLPSLGREQDYSKRLKLDKIIMKKRKKNRITDKIYHLSSNASVKLFGNELEISYTQRVAFFPGQIEYEEEEEEEEEGGGRRMRRDAAGEEEIVLGSSEEFEGDLTATEDQTEEGKSSSCEEEEGEEGEEEVLEDSEETEEDQEGEETEETNEMTEEGEEDSTSSCEEEEGEEGEEEVLEDSEETEEDQEGEETEETDEEEEEEEGGGRRMRRDAVGEEEIVLGSNKEFEGDLTVTEDQTEEGKSSSCEKEEEEEEEEGEETDENEGKQGELVTEHPCSSEEEEEEGGDCGEKNEGVKKIWKSELICPRISYIDIPDYFRTTLPTRRDGDDDDDDRQCCLEVPVQTIGKPSRRDGDDHDDDRQCCLEVPVQTIGKPSIPNENRGREMLQTS